jgi:hypothetical protein
MQALLGFPNQKSFSCSMINVIFKLTQARRESQDIELDNLVSDQQHVG